MSEEAIAQEEAGETQGFGWSEAEPTQEAQAAEAPAQNNGEWFFAEDVPGKGDRPEWMKEKYKTVADQAKAYVELEKRMGEVKGAPKDGYALDALDGIAADDPLVQHFAETFKEMNVSQEGFQRVVSEFLDMQSSVAQVDAQKEIEKLGLDGGQQVKQIDTWLNNTFDADTAKTIKSWVATADDIKALQALKAFQPASAIPTGNQHNAGGYETVQELKNEQMNNWDKYKNDENYRNRWRSRLENAMVREKASR